MTRGHGGRLPRELERLVAAQLEAADLDPEAAAELESDLIQHFHDGLAAGRSVAELVRRFGDPGVAGPMLTAAMRDRAYGPTGSTGQGRGRRRLAAIASDAVRAWRSLRAQPVHVATVTTVLALGLGANALTFTILDELFLEALPVADQASLVGVLADVPGGNSFTGFSVPDFEDLRTRNDVLVDLAAISALRARLGSGGQGEPAVVTLASPSYFELLGVDPALGTVDLPEPRGWGDDRVAVVSEPFWRSRLGSRPDVIGSSIVLDGWEATVVGVAAPGFTGTFIGFPTDVWVPLSAVGVFREGFDPYDRSERFLELLGRKRPGVTDAEAERGLDEIAAELERTYPDLNRGHRVRVVPLTGIDDSLRSGVVGFVTILAAVSVLVLLVACLNVGGVLTARTLAREREVAVKVALGAGRIPLVRELVTESVLLAAAGAIGGVLLAAWAGATLRDFLSAVSGGVGLRLAPDGTALILTAAATAAAAALVTVAPALQVVRGHPAAVLRMGRSAPRTGMARAVLVVGQVAFTVALVVVAGLFVRALQEGLVLDPGFDADRVAAMAVTPEPSSDRVDSGAAWATALEAVERLRVSPGVTSAALARLAPVSVARTPARVSVPGVEPPPDAEGWVVDLRAVGEGYFATLGAPVLSGRAFEPEDGDGPPRVAVISDAFRRRFLTDRTAVGASIDVDGRPLRVVGVVADVRYVLQDETPDPLVYMPLMPSAGPVTVVFAAAGDPMALEAPVRSALGPLLPEGRAAPIRSVREVMSGALLPQRLGAVLVGSLGLVALLLASVGLYGLVLQSVRRDLPAFGIRLALGGARGRVVLWVLRRAVGLVAVGGAVGMVAATLVAPALRPFLGTVSPHDPVTYGAVLLLFVAVAVLTSAAPALRAARVDPASTLRIE